MGGTGEEVRAYLPNTARLTDVLVPDARLILARNDDPHRRTRWTVTRVRDGTWVALEAGAVSGLVADHLGPVSGCLDGPHTSGSAASAPTTVTGSTSSSISPTGGPVSSR